MSTDSFLDTMAKEYDDEVDFDALRIKADNWIEKALELLTKGQTFYRLAAKQLETKRGAEAAFPGYEFEDKDRDELRKLFLDYLEMSKKVKELNPSRFFLFQVMKAEIKQLEDSGTVPETYLELELGHREIIDRLCLSGLLLVPKVCHEPKGNLSPSERGGEGNVGLVLAAHKFDFDRVKNGKPVKFSTCARLWIQERVYDRIYRDAFYLKVDDKGKKAYFQNQKGIETDEALAFDVGNAAFPVSLDSSSEEDRSSIADTIDNSHGIGSPIVNPEEERAAQEWAEAAKTALAQHLSELEFKVIEAKFKALNLDGEMTDMEIAKALKIASTKIPEILASAISKVRTIPECRVLFEQLKR